MGLSVKKQGGINGAGDLQIEEEARSSHCRVRELSQEVE